MLDIPFLGLSPFVLVLGFALDYCLGEKTLLPHPVRLIGATIDFLDELRNRFRSNERVLGWIVAVLLPSIFCLLTILVLLVAQYIHVVLMTFIKIYFLWALLSVRSMIDAGDRILQAVAKGNMEVARAEVGKIVGRDTSRMNEQDICRAGVESVAEGFLDGVLSPFFWGLLAGIPGIIFFKTVSTLDSMVGYRSEEYRAFGEGSAILDDCLNWFPARISLLLIPSAALVSGKSFRRCWLVGWSDRTNHPSPNAGHPESLFAGALNCRLGGVTRYENFVEQKPPIHSHGRPTSPDSLRNSLRMYVSASLITVIVSFVIILTV